MNIVAIGSDRSLCNPTSASADRQRAYGKHFDTLTILVFSHRSHNVGPVALSQSVHVYPTQSRSKLLYGLDAGNIARRLGPIDVVTVQDPFEGGLIGWIIARVRRARFHVQVHTDFLAPEFRHTWQNVVRVVVARFVIGRADGIRVVSERIKGSIEKTYAPRASIAVVPIYVDLTKFRTAYTGILTDRFKQFDARVLVVARLEKEKNVSLALEAFARSAPLRVCLIIVGEGSERKRLEARASALGVSSRVFFEGTRDPVPYYALADLVLVPSLYEGYGLVIVEALAAGKPVLANDVGVARSAGAQIAGRGHFADALETWFNEGARIGVLTDYPYKSFEQYVAAYASDIKRCAH